VPRKPALVLLTKVGWKQGKILQSEEGSMLENVLFAAEGRSKATGLIFCLEDSFMRKFSSSLREKSLRLFFGRAA
jgi:hypothetical protein